MRAWAVFCHELGTQARRAAPWLSFAVLLVLIAKVATESYLPRAREGEFPFNASLPVTLVCLFGSLLALVPAAWLAGEAATRDVQARMDPLIFTTPVGKGPYLAGRFLAAFVLTALVTLAVPAGPLLAALAPGVEPEVLGPFRPAAYLLPYLLVVLPNAFLATALCFGLAALGRRTLVATLGALLLFATSVVSLVLVAFKLGRWDVARLMDPLGMTVLSELSRTWSPADKAARLLLPEGALLHNRLLWLGLALAGLALTLLRFRFAHHTPRGRWWRAAATRDPGVDLPPAPRSAAPALRAHVPPRPVAGTRAHQVLAVAGRSFRSVVVGWSGLALAGFGVFVVFATPALLTHIEVPLRPMTSLMMPMLNMHGDLFWLLVPLVTLLAAGELVWAEREARLDELADATPVPDWVPLLGKLLGLCLVLVALQAFLVAASVLAQARMGYHDLELGLYARTLLGLTLVDRFLLAVLAVGVHVLVGHKYAGHLVLLVLFALRAFVHTLGARGELVVFGAGPEWEYSDLRGFGPELVTWLWYRAYWAGWAVLLAVAARLLWVRGLERRPRERLRSARGCLTRPVGAVALAAAVLVLGTGASLLLRTPGRDADAQDARSAEYERRYARHAAAAQPVRTETRLRVDVHPRDACAELRGTHVLVNRGTAPVDVVHLTTVPRVRTHGVRLDRPATRVLYDPEHGFETWALRAPLRPGETLRLDFEVHVGPQGLPLPGAPVSEHATVLPVSALLPAVGYRATRELDEAGARRAHGLAARPDLPPPEEAASVSVLPLQRARFDVVVTTDAGQLALAPGALRRSWAEGGRRAFHYVTDAPILDDVTVVSGAYAVHTARWRDVDIEVVHHPRHAHNVERMVRAVQLSLEHLTAELGPYPHRQLRFVEHPGRKMLLHSSPVNVWFEEGFAHLDPDADPRGVDFASAIVAHEVAHQWWGNQLTPARVQGGALLSESLAWYAAMGAVERAHGPDGLRRLLDLMREAFLAPHTRAGPPLLRATDWLQAYRKGPFAMYALRELAGEAQVSAALRGFLARHRDGAPPLPTSLDLYRALQEALPEPHHPLLHDLLAANTYWELRTDRATAEPLEDGTWRVTLDVRARKRVFDEEGGATEAPMDDTVEVAVYGRGDADAPLYQGRHRVRSGTQRLTVTVQGEPGRAGVDPRRLLLDVEPEDNVRDVQSAGAVAQRAPAGP